MASVNLSALSTPVSDTQREKAIAEALSRLEQDISSGNSSAAQQDYATLKSQLPDTSPVTSRSAESTTPTISLEQILDQLDGLGGSVHNTSAVAGHTTVPLQRESSVAAINMESAAMPMTGVTLDAYM